MRESFQALIRHEITTIVKANPTAKMKELHISVRREEC